MFVLSEPHILHADVDAFFASVEQRDDPALRGRPVIVGGGVVMAASYEARAYGIRGGMGGGEARRRCPHATVVSSRFGAYVEASRAVFDVLRAAAPAVEALGLEEAFLDVREVDAPAREVAERIRRDVRERAGLPITVGVARSKILAKMAGRAAKPDGLLVVPADGEADFLHPLRVEELWGVGAATAAKLHERGVRTVGQVAELPLGVLVAVLGDAAGRLLYSIAHNEDRRPVCPDRRRRSFGAQRARRLSAATPEQLDDVLGDLADRVCRRMERSGRSGRTVVLRLRFEDFSRATRSLTLPATTAAADEVHAALRELLAGIRQVIDRQGLTMLGLTVTNLDGDERGEQLVLPARRPRATRGGSAHADEVDDEDERLVGADDAARAALAVGEVGRDRDAAAPTDFHAGHSLVPARDDLPLAEAELEGVAAIPRGVELVARGPRHADVVDLDDAAGDRLVAVTDGDVLDFELVRGRRVGRDGDVGLLVGGHRGTVAHRSTLRCTRIGGST